SWVGRCSGRWPAALVQPALESNGAVAGLARDVPGREGLEGRVRRGVDRYDRCPASSTSGLAVWAPCCAAATDDSTRKRSSAAWAGFSFSPLAVDLQEGCVGSRFAVRVFERRERRALVSDRHFENVDNRVDKVLDVIAIQVAGRC